MRSNIVIVYIQKKKEQKTNKLKYMTQLLGHGQRGPTRQNKQQNHHYYPEDRTKVAV